MPLRSPIRPKELPSCCEWELPADRSQLSALLGNALGWKEPLCPRSRPSSWKQPGSNDWWGGWEEEGVEVQLPASPAPSELQRSTPAPELGLAEILSWLNHSLNSASLTFPAGGEQEDTTQQTPNTQISFSEPAFWGTQTLTGIYWGKGCPVESLTWTRHAACDDFKTAQVDSLAHPVRL